MRFPHLLRSPPSSPPASLSQLSFAEVMQLVQEGKEVPGVTKPDVQPSNQCPTPSQMQRVQKPLTEVMLKLSLLRDKTKSRQKNISTMSVAPSYEERGKRVISVHPLMHPEHIEMFVKHMK
uniref:Peroxisomal membrane protein PEX14-like KPWE domain-containing protein n=1 Tax=Xiphophorus couchianus TaxID=32473 RepID=A0A3B5M6J9_9TELE